MKNRLARDIRRGKAEIYIAVEYPAGEEIDVSYNRQYLSGWLHTLGTISREHGVPGEISLADVAKNHDVFVVKKAEPAEQELTDQVLSVLEEALEAFLAARRREARGPDARHSRPLRRRSKRRCGPSRPGRPKRWRNTAANSARACRRCWPRA